MMYRRRATDAIFVQCFLCSLLGVFTPTSSTATDIYCLKSIKESLEDPFGYLKSSWDFTNNTEGFICRFTGVECWHPDENKVLNLRLSDMGLEGQFPLGVQHCKRITGLDLSNNEFYGPIPSNISKILSYLTSLDLSSNSLSGEIPESIAEMRYLNLLKLDHNQLTGQIPLSMSFLDRLKSFSVANNNLSGPVPEFTNHSFTLHSYSYNTGLCGKPLEVCKYPRRKYEYSFENGFAIGYVVSMVVVITLYGSYCVPWIHDRKRNKMITVAAVIMLILKKIFKKNKADADLLQSLSTLEFLLETQVSTSENFVTRMSYKDLRNATDNFSQSNIIGFEEMGTMYKATLPNGWSLAVKKFSNSQQSEEHFITELMILGKLRHTNLLPLLGFCKESKKRFLVYKYVSRGNIFDSLHSTEGKKVLKWPLRMRIATGLARGLSWLHHCCEFRVAHLNVSSKNILLDQNFEPQLSNFGKATLIDPKEISGSRGFCIDIEFWEECFVKEDVYHFGIVFLELITGRNAIDLNNSDGMLDKSTSFDFLSLKISDLNDVIDELLIGQGHDYEIMKCLKIACDCVNSLPEERPTMLDVYTTLSIIMDKYDE